MIKMNIKPLIIIHLIQQLFQVYHPLLLMLTPINLKLLIKKIIVRRRYQKEIIRKQKRVLIAIIKISLKI
eukprot:jgi/Orpsp1_1/1182475/evm.model.c7180000081436.1